MYTSPLQWGLRGFLLLAKVDNKMSNIQVDCVKIDFKNTVLWILNTSRNYSGRYAVLIL